MIKELKLQDIAKFVYFRPMRAENLGEKIETLYNKEGISYFSLGRYAILESIKRSNLKNKTVLFPYFICSDVLAPFFQEGVKIKFYHVDKNLNIEITDEELLGVTAIFYVNYFGFPHKIDSQLLSKLKERKTLILEDNCHGLFSKDEEGVLLGTRGDYGFFSIRKTIRVGLSAFLLDSHTSSEKNLRQWNGVFKDKKEIFRYFPRKILFWILGIVRIIRKSKMDVSEHLDLEKQIPFENELSHNIFSLEKSVNVADEILFRKKAFDLLSQHLEAKGFSPVFKSRQENVVPYGVPFYVEENQVDKFRNTLKELELEFFSWPDLPSEKIELETIQKTFYRKVKVVNLLW